MTREEAARIIDPETTGEAYKDWVFKWSEDDAQMAC